MLQVISRTKEKAQIILSNNGKSKTVHLKFNPKKRRFENSKGLPFFLSVLFAVIMCFSSPVQAQVKARMVNGNYYPYPSVQEYSNTGKVFTDNKGDRYIVYVSSKGKLFVFKTSAKTGKIYKSYLKI